MRFKKTIITAGFAMFSMFFGSGNLVFPLTIGTQSLDKSPYAMIGLMVTGVLVPFLGLIGVILYDGSRERFFASIGKNPAFLLTLTMLSLMGPFGVVPRCILVAYGGIQLFWPNLPFYYFSAGFYLTTLCLVWKNERIIPILGRVLTPFLLLGILTLIGAGLYKGPHPLASSLYPSEVFHNALNIGYQTMDLLAAFFFSATTVAYLHRHLRKGDSPSILIKLSVISCLIGGGLLAIVYISFIALGARYAAQLSAVNPEQMLAAIAGFMLGDFAIPVASITIALACLTTATVLVMLFADFFHEDIAQKKVGQHPSVIMTLVISFIISLSGFDKLAIWIQNTLWIAYPALIALTIANIISIFSKINLGKWAFWVTLAITTTCYVVG